MDPQKIPLVFISYCWTSESHKQWVLDLATRLLEESGVDVILDMWDTERGHDRFHFMEDSVRRADVVLVICDQKYCEKANNREGGVGVETQIISPKVYESVKQKKFIPIALSKKDNGEYLLPEFLNSRFALGMTDKSNFDRDYEELERIIWQEPLLKRPVRGKKPDFSTKRRNISDGVSTERSLVSNDTTRNLPPENVNESSNNLKKIMCPRCWNYDHLWNGLCKKCGLKEAYMTVPRNSKYYGTSSN